MKKEKPKTLYCEDCKDWEGKKRKATMICPRCKRGYCTKHANFDNTICPYCTPELEDIDE